MIRNIDDYLRQETTLWQGIAEKGYDPAISYDTAVSEKRGRTMYESTFYSTFVWAICFAFVWGSMLACSLQEHSGNVSPAGDEDIADIESPETDGADHDGDTDRLAVPVFGSIASPPTSSVLKPELSSCPVYMQTSCENDTLRRCEIYDAIEDEWAANPDPFLEQIYWYDRYYDLYHRMEGQQAEFRYTKPMPPGTPESEWGAPENFEAYSGYWDSAGWTGTALQAASARYLSTGTEADYERMLQQLEAMAFFYEATGVPGLLMRCHYAMLEEGAPDPVGHPGKALVHYAPPEVWQDCYTLAPEYADRLPSYYKEGVDIQGTHYDVIPSWMGDSSRDMYVRSLPGIMLAYDLLGDGVREDEMRAVIKREIPCTLKRMKKMRIRNIQKNAEFKEAIAAYLGSNRLQLEPQDIDLTSLDIIYAYVMEQPRSDKWELFDVECPNTPPMEVNPEYDLDAGSNDFMLRFMGIAVRLQRQGDIPIAWIQFPSVRGSDALFMTQWALSGHYLTGDERFLEFLERLMNEIDYWPVINTMGSFWLPKWCRSHYGPSLLYPTFWNIQNRVDRNKYSEFWSKLGRAIKEEFRYKELKGANDSYFGVLYETMVDEVIDPDVYDYTQSMVAMLRETGQYQVEDRFEPRRSYNVDLLYDPPPGVSFETEELTQDKYDICMEPIEIFGMSIEGYVEDELPRAKEGLLIPFRIAGPFQWQEDPYMLWKDYGDLNARVQWPMQGFSVAFWTGLIQGTMIEGRGKALAWRDKGEPCP